MSDIERFDRELLKGNTDTMVLALLAECGPMHGYDLAKEMRRRAGSSLRLGQGVLYPVLHRLERRGLLQGEWEQRVGSPSRKRYRITNGPGGAPPQAHPVARIRRGDGTHPRAADGASRWMRSIASSTP